MGTPDFAVASLRRLVEDGHEVVGVFTQPDKPKNRGMKLTFSPVKEYALTQDLPVYQPLKMRDGEALGILRELAPELIVVAAYGKILPQEILDLPQYGCINVHSSLLPTLRAQGATAPSGPRNDKSGGLTPYNACCKYCLPARRSMSAATARIESLA